MSSVINFFITKTSTALCKCKLIQFTAHILQSDYEGSQYTARATWENCSIMCIWSSSSILSANAGT